MRSRRDIGGRRGRERAADPARENETENGTRELGKKALPSGTAHRLKRKRTEKLSSSPDCQGSLVVVLKLIYGSDGI